MATRSKRPPLTVDAAKCFGCLNCELRCSLRFEKAFSPVHSAIQVRRLVGADMEYAISVTDRCDNCGICVRFCPYGALA